MNVGGSVSVGLGVLCSIWFSTALNAAEAPGPGNTPSSWASANKQAFGTSLTNKSKVWFTTSEGIVTEVFWPTIDRPQIRDSQIIVTGQGFFFEERKDSVTQVQWLETGVPAFKTINRDRSARLEIERIIYTDPDRDSVIQKITVRRFVPGLRVFLLHKPAVGNTPWGDFARAVPGAQGALFAWQGKEAQALVTSIPFAAAAAGFENTPSDVWQDLNHHHALTLGFDQASSGNVALAAELAVPPDTSQVQFDWALSFAADPIAAQQVAQASLASVKVRAQFDYISGWRAYQAKVKDLGAASHDGGKLFRSSVALLRAMEDKTFEGAIVASPSIPWGPFQKATDQRLGGYHLIWPRDLFQMATSFLAIEDVPSAVRSLNAMKRMQWGPLDGNFNLGSRSHKKDGALRQNSWVNGDNYWLGLQQDQTAYPIILAYRLWARGAIQLPQYWDMVRRAADQIHDFGPWTQQERWEESQGASPSSIAAMISALWSASVLAHNMGDEARAKGYQAVADQWSSKPGDNLDTWTFTTTGGLGNGHYYERIEGAANYDQVWNPNDETRYFLAGGGGNFREKDVIDAGFLELVRQGVRPAMHPQVLESLVNVDSTIAVHLIGRGTAFRRYNGDRYNFDDTTGAVTPGMPWPIFAGERGHYELQRANEQGLSALQRNRAVDPYIDSMEKFANASSMIPEQVWDAGPKAGQSTGCATPLGWAHAEYIKLLRSKSDGVVFDRIWPLGALRKGEE